MLFFRNISHKLFQTISTLIYNTINFIILNIKCYIVILFLIIINKPVIIFFMNFIISFLILGMFISVIYDDERTAHEEIYNIKPVYLSNLLRWFIKGLLFVLNLESTKSNVTPKTELINF